MLKIHNTLTKKKEMFIPLEKGKVGMYVCGPTVNGVPHAGHAKQKISFDVIARYLRYLGNKVNYVSNITDVDDKIIIGARNENIPVSELVNKYIKAHKEAYAGLELAPLTSEPRATEHIKDMVKLINILLKKKYAYLSADGSIYYDISKFKEYGKLSHTKIKELKEGASKRINNDEYEKEQANDFALWKAYTKDDGETFWNAEFFIDGKKHTIAGRPGWHIECSVMSMEYIGTMLDIHGGGHDLIFPHHENEIAQSEAITGKQFVKYWMHNGFVTVDGKKMSKSLGNFVTIADLLKKYDGKVIRLFVLSTHYRKPVDFANKHLETAKNSILRIHEFVKKLKAYESKSKDSKDSDDAVEKLKENFKIAMDDDFDTPKALIALFEFVRAMNILLDKKSISSKNAKTALKSLEEIDTVLGFIIPGEMNIPDSIKLIVDEREKARKDKDWKKSDYLREEMRKSGYWVDDTSEGPKIRKT